MGNPPHSRSERDRAAFVGGAVERVDRPGLAE